MNEKVKLALIGLALVVGIYGVIKSSTVEANLNERIDGILALQQNSSQNNVVTPVVNNINPTQNTQANTPQSNTQTPTGPSTSIRFNEEVHDFGNVDVNTDNPHSFVFTNTGKEPLLITNAKGSCGCTVPSWPKDPIMPGAIGKIDVVFKPSKGQAGMPQEKTVTITANTEPVNTVVRVKAMVNPEG